MPVKSLNLTPRISRSPRIPKPKAALAPPSAGGLRLGKMTEGTKSAGIPKLPRVSGGKALKGF